MDKTITTVLLIVISMVMAVALFNVAYPATLQAGDALTNMASRSSDRLRSQVEIIHATAEIAADGDWHDVNGNGNFDVFVWVKNIGASRIAPIERVDVFFGPEGNFGRIPHQSEANGGYPYWTTSVSDGGDWTPTATLEIDIHHLTPAESGRYFVRVVTPNGVSDNTFFSW